MTYMLTADVFDESRNGYAEYLAYLEANRERFPPGAYALATSDWYHGFTDPRAPHDARLLAVTVAEVESSPSASDVTIRIRLSSAEGGEIELFYPRVFAYRMDLQRGKRGHRDWRYDEFRLTDDGHLLHEIEWWSSEETARWIIEADDVEHRWIPPGATGPPAPED
jgi:hypothetical protein